MEELRSTEILDKEIELDAQKKAKKILENAERECQTILAGVNDRVEKAVAEKSAFYKNKISQLQKNAAAFIPLEKERFLVSFYDHEVSAALNDYFNSIGKEKRLALLAKKLEGCSAAIENKKITLSYFGGLSEKDAEEAAKSISSKNISKVQEIAFEKSGEEAVAGNELHEGLVLASDDNSVKVRLTMDQLVRELKDKYSNELATTLFNGVLPE